jgi:hypothetical protein
MKLSRLTLGAAIAASAAAAPAAETITYSYDVPRTPRPGGAQRHGQQRRHHRLPVRQADNRTVKTTTARPIRVRRKPFRRRAEKTIRLARQISRSPLREWNRAPASAATEDILESLK